MLERGCNRYRKAEDPVGRGTRFTSNEQAADMERQTGFTWNEHAADAGRQKSRQKER